MYIPFLYWSKFPYLDNMSEYTRQLQRFNVGEDCPVFDGLYEYCQLYTSGSIGINIYILITYNFNEEILC